MLPDLHDSKRDLWLKIAYNFYSMALGGGAGGLTPPNWNDSCVDLIRKVTYYSAVA